MCVSGRLAASPVAVAATVPFLVGRGPGSDFGTDAVDLRQCCGVVGCCVVEKGDSDDGRGEEMAALIDLVQVGVAGGGGSCERGAQSVLEAMEVAVGCWVICI